MEARTHTAYEHGYLTAVAGQARVVPLTVAEGYPDCSGEWLQGYDDAESESEQERARTIAAFGVGRQAD